MPTIGCAHCASAVRALGASAAGRCASRRAARRRARARARASRPGRGASATARCATMARRARRDARAAGPSPARPGRDLAAAGAARRRARPGWRRMPRERRARRHHLGAALARPAARARSTPTCAAIACATSTTTATPTRASRATGCAAGLAGAERGLPDAEAGAGRRGAAGRSEASACAGRAGRSSTWRRVATATALDVRAWRALSRRAAQQRAARLAAATQPARGAPAAWSSACWTSCRRGAPARWPIARRRAAPLSRACCSLDARRPPTPASAAARDRAAACRAPARYRAARLGRRAARRRASSEGGVPLAWLRARRAAARAQGGEQFQAGTGATAAQPEEAVPGGRRAGLGARRPAASTAAANCCSCRVSGIDARVSGAARRSRKWRSLGWRRAPRPRR